MDEKGATGNKTISDKVSNSGENDNSVYNPFEHREVEKPVSNVRATANLIKSSLGSGLLAGPLAFVQSGWLIGIFGTLIVGILCGHCIHILVKTSRGCCRREKKPMLNYAETCKSTFENGPKFVRPFANTASIITEFALTCTYVGVCCIYTVLISDSIKQIVDKFVPTSAYIPVQHYSLMIAIPIIILCQIRYLKFLAIFSLLANILLLGTYLVCLYYIFGNEINFTDKVAVGNPARYPAFLATVIFAMEGVGVVMPIENEMKRPKNFLGCPSVLFVAMSIIVFLYISLGLFGYFRYGAALKGSITLNLPMDEWPAICGKVFIALSIFFTYPLQYFVVFDVFTRYVRPKVKQSYWPTTQFICRTLGVCFCVGIGIALPLLEQIINIVGSLFYSILGIMIPAVVETIFNWEDLGRFNWLLIKNIIIFAFGMLTLVAGCAVTISDIIVKLGSKTA
ncbi:hypothetical protein O0L34_g8738 [Tuta absoluta]|nr:hypothetical protein O0L34_g8738 [Tuta absoluta]